MLKTKGIVERTTREGSILLTTEGVKKIPMVLNEGEVIDTLTFEKVDVDQNAILQEVQKNIEKEIEKQVKAKFNCYENEILKNKELLEKAKQIAKTIKLAILEQRDFIVRFHADADGACGALALKRLLKENYFGKAFFIPQKVACYSQIDFENDNFLCVSLKKPILFFIDFSPKEEIAKKINLQMVVIDHHPTDVKDSLNPWNFGYDSRITAGLLACFVSKLISGENFEILENISLHGDRSELLNKKDENFVKLAIVVDFLINKKRLSSVEKILNKNELIEEEYREAKNLIENAITLAKKFEKIIKVKDYSIHILNLKKQKIYPQPGKLVSIFQERLNNEKAITIGISRNAISVRVGKEVLKKVDLFLILNKIGANFGGHKNAFSIRINGEKLVLKKFIEELQKSLEAT